MKVFFSWALTVLGAIWAWNGALRLYVVLRVAGKPAHEIEYVLGQSTLGEYALKGVLTLALAAGAIWWGHYLRRQSPTKVEQAADQEST